jgi:hypothetical protein
MVALVGVRALPQVELGVIEMDEKEKALRFLKKLETYLNSTIPSPERVQARIAEAMQAAKAAERKSTERHSTFAEGAFLNTFVLPKIHAFLKSELKLSPGDAKQALLSESWQSQTEYTSGSPVRPGAHPFRKIVGLSPQHIMAMWRGKGGVPGKSCPDLALRRPALHPTVFEAKYYTNPSVKTAEAELVRNLYQAFFYLALPRRPEMGKYAAWEYDFACVLAYDATPSGVLLDRWKSLPRKVRDACWAGNIYVMVLRGTPSA